MSEQDVPLYRWGEWPEHLLTKKQMAEAGYQTGRKLPPPAGKVWREKSPDGVMWLYDSRQGVPKRAISDEERARLDAARKKAQAGWYCIKCGGALGGYFPDCMCERCGDKWAAHRWAQRVLKTPGRYVILDTETTGLSAEYHEIIQIALTDAAGNPLLDSLVKPMYPERMYEKGESGRCAFDIHGISAESVADAPCWAEVFRQVLRLVRGKRILIYNADYDTAMMEGMCQMHGVFYPHRMFAKRTTCAMLKYSAWVNNWSRYWKNYRWQALNGGHSALSDCRAVAGCLREMAVNAADVT